MTNVNFAEIQNIAATVLSGQCLAHYSYKPPTVAEISALDIRQRVSSRRLPTYLSPSDRLLVTESPRILVSTLSLDTMSPADRSAKSGSCRKVERYAWFLRGNQHRPRSMTAIFHT